MSSEILLSNKNEFYQQHLNRVSRSFAFCIEQLHGSFRSHIAMSYILFRILDTIEDASWSSQEAQQKAFDEFFKFLKIPETFDSVIKSDVISWGKNFPDLPEGERLLLNDALEIFNDFQCFEPRNRAVILRGLESMGRGMRYFLKTSKHSRLVLKNLVEVNRYCFFVAGVVGELLENLFEQICEPRTRSHERLVDAFHFGLFLQKINLLKDQLGDELEGRHLIPSRSVVKLSLKANANHALAYLLSIPVAHKSYRIFCAWSLFLGLASMPYIEKSYAEKTKHKISRLRTWQVLRKVKSIIDDNDKLAKYFLALLEKGTYDSSSSKMIYHEPQAAGLNSDAAPLGTSQDEFLSQFKQLYSGRIDLGDLALLGLT